MACCAYTAAFKCFLAPEATREIRSIFAAATRRPADPGALSRRAVPRAGRPVGDGRKNYKKTCERRAKSLRKLKKTYAKAVPKQKQTEKTTEICDYVTARPLKIGIGVIRDPFGIRSGSVQSPFGFASINVISKHSAPCFVLAGAKY